MVWQARSSGITYYIRSISEIVRSGFKSNLLRYDIFKAGHRDSDTLADYVDAEGKPCLARTDGSNDGIDLALPQQPDQRPTAASDPVHGQRASTAVAENLDRKGDPCLARTDGSNERVDLRSCYFVWRA